MAVVVVVLSLSIPSKAFDAAMLPPDEVPCLTYLGKTSLLWSRIMMALEARQP